MARKRLQADTLDSKATQAPVADAPSGDPELLDADEAMARCSEQELLRVRHVQHWDVTALHAIFGSISHFVGHTHQIVYITRLRIGETYQFHGLTAADE